MEGGNVVDGLMVQFLCYAGFHPPGESSISKKTCVFGYQQ